MPTASTFMAAMKDFFGFNTKPDGSKQTLTEFSMEVKKLNPEDRLYFIKGLQQNGYPIPEGTV